MRSESSSSIRSSAATSHIRRVWKRVVLITVIGILMATSMGILPFDSIPPIGSTMPSSSSEPIYTRFPTSSWKQHQSGGTREDAVTDDQSSSSIATPSSSLEQQQEDNGDDDRGDDYGDWLWDTTASNPRLHSPTFIPGNVRYLLSREGEDKEFTTSRMTSKQPEEMAVDSPLTIEDFQRSVNSIRQCREIGGGKVGKASPFVQSLGKHLYQQYTEDIQRHQQQQKQSNKKETSTENDPKQQHPQHSSSRPRIMYNCESDRMGRFCGGMGDRFRGMISTFYLSLLSNRRFELFHPVPLPLQRYLRPHLINWIPTKSSNKNGDSSTTAFNKLLYELDTDTAISTPDSSMMSIKGHSTFLKKLERRTKEETVGGRIADFGSSTSGASKNGNDFRIQTNSIGVDGFITSVKTPTLWSRRQDIFGAYTTASGGGLDSSKVNISTYFGCLYEVMFQPAPALLNSAATALGPNISRITRGHLQQQGGDGDVAKMEAEGGGRGRVVVHSAISVPQTRTTGATGEHRIRLHLHTPYIGMQVRMGGSWAAGMVVKEPFRTSPEAVDDFFSVVEDVRSASGNIIAVGGKSTTSVSSSPASTTAWPLFVSSDSERFIEETKKKFGVGVVRFVQGGFQHTDTLNFQEAKQRAKNKSNNNSQPPQQQSIQSSTSVEDKLQKQLVRRQEYLSTLTNHYLLGLSHHVIMAQSGFGDTAYWRSRREASCIFVNMKNLKTAWQHHLSYRVASGPSSAPVEGGGDSGLAPRRLNALSRALENSNPEWFPSPSQQSISSATSITVASSRCNRIFDVSQQQSTFYSEKCPAL